MSFEMRAYNGLAPEITFSVTQHCTTRWVTQLKAFNPDQVIIAGVCIIRQDQVTHPHLKLCFTLAIATIGSWFSTDQVKLKDNCWNCTIYFAMCKASLNRKADKGTPMMKASALNWFEFLSMKLIHVRVKMVRVLTSLCYHVSNLLAKASNSE